jgi:hypothetical protein
LCGGPEVGLGEMGDPVELAYLVSVDDLHDICDALNDGKCEYNLTCDDEKIVALAYNDGPDDLNSICFTFPIVGNLNWPSRVFGKQFPFGEDGLMVCLHSYAGKQIRRGLYLEDEMLKWNGIEDWEKFWPPLEAAPIKGMECRSR